MNRKHGMHGSPEWRSWNAMRRRCRESHTYPNYRAISVCPEWDESFDAFYRDMGPRPVGKTLDRIDNNKGYEPSNCRWADRLTQTRNRRMADMVTWNGVTKNASAWAHELGIPTNKLFYLRKTRGLSMDEIAARLQGAS